MANEISVTTGDVRPLTGAEIRRAIAGATPPAFGDVVYISSTSNGLPVVSKCNGGAVATANPFGIVISTNNPGATAPAAGDAVDVVVFGPVTGYDSMSAGATVWVSDTVGRLSSVVGTKSGVVGFAETDTVVFVRPGLFTVSA